MIWLRGEDETDAISRDIELVVKAAIRGIVLEGLPAPLLSDLEGELILRADRTFLWTTLMIKLLKERSEAGASRRELDAILQSRSIDAIYAGLLEGRKDPAQARKMLNIILAATQPLTLEELKIALAIKPDHNTFTDSFAPRRPGRGTFDGLILDLVYPFENYVKSLCEHFLRVIHGKVYLVHKTAREFLCLERESSKTEIACLQSPANDNTVGSDEEGPLILELDDNSASKGKTEIHSSIKDGESEDVLEAGLIFQHSFSLKEAHPLLMEICVTYLYFLAKSKSYAGGAPPREVSKFRNYAATYWTVHFGKVCSSILSKDLPYYQGLCHPRPPRLPCPAGKSGPFH
jgi:protein SERAC1